MSRARNKRVRAPRPATPRPRLAIAAALAFAIVCALPIVTGLNPYPVGVGRFWLQGTIATLIAAALLARIPAPNALARMAALINRPPPLAFAAIVAVVTIVLGAYFSLSVFNGVATTSDEVAQLWHAKMLVHGWLSLPVDPNPEFFAIDNVIDTGRWYSEYPIGGPAILALGVAIGASWLVNPLLTGVGVAATYSFARRAFGETQARAIAGLMTVTPVILLMAGTHMNHVATLALLACVLAALAEWERAATRTRRVVFAVLVGLALGIMATVRPLDALVAAVCIGAFQVSIAFRVRARAPELAAQTIAGALGVAPVFYANAATTGSAFTFGYEILWGTAHGIGFHADPQGGVHTLGRALQYAVTYVSELNLTVMLWPMPVLLIAVLGLISMQRTTRWDALLLGLFWMQVIAYAAYWFQGEFLGPRFLFPVVPVVVLLVARAPFHIAERFGDYWGRTAVVGALLCVIATWWVSALPIGASQTAKIMRDTRPVHKLDFADAVARANVHNAVVVMREPLRTRLLRRMWGVGVSRSDAAQWIEKRDACSLLSAVNATESDSTPAGSAKAIFIDRAAAPFVRRDSALAASFTVHISSVASLTPECRAELDGDATLGGAPFGPVLPLLPIDESGRINGDVIYIADLGTHNAVLKQRFAGRTWYRLLVKRSTTDQSLHIVLEPYDSTNVGR